MMEWSRQERIFDLYATTVPEHHRRKKKKKQENNSQEKKESSASACPEATDKWNTKGKTWLTVVSSHGAVLWQIHACDECESIGGSVVEFSPATREARVQFPANAFNAFCMTPFSKQNSKKKSFFFASSNKIAGSLRSRKLLFDA